MFYTTTSKFPFADLKSNFSGELFFDNSTEHQAVKRLYATDASVYQEMPLAVALPKNAEDLKQLIAFAVQHKTSLIPRAAGTSLAGQVVGSGIVVDISKYFDKILEVNAEERWVRVQPGVVRDDLNVFLKPYGLFFGPETSTANRAMIGGMIGNNSCGLHSVVWGSTRDHLLAVEALLSDGSEVKFSPIARSGETLMTTAAPFHSTESQDETSDLRAEIYAKTFAVLSNPDNQHEIRSHFPKPSVTRRNTGYALDALLNEFSETGLLNLCKLIAGSEGTLCLITEAKLNLLPLPPPFVGLVCVHCTSIDESLRANLVALKHNCWASELMDDYILELTKANTEQAKNREFVVGEPKAVLMVEFFAETETFLFEKCEQFITDLKTAQLGYAYPILTGEESKKAWNVRKAGLSLMYNIEGPDKPANVIEDCAVDVNDLPAYIADLEKIGIKHNLRLEHSAHAAAGEIHTLPLINLKSSEGRQKFRALLADTAALVKSYGGSLSGEHGDGRLRGEFIPFMVGEKNYQLFEEIKQTWDPNGIFNPGKIVNTPPMNEFLRYEADQPTPKIDTVFRFDNEDGLLGLAEKCSGSGDCRKTHITGGTMCPSYMATRQEKDTTRARANILRHYYTPAPQPLEGEPTKTHPLGGEGLVKNVLDLCLSCKGCQSECPSSVDVGKMKAEFTQQYYDQHGVPLRARLVGNFTKQMKLASLVPWGYNLLFGTAWTRRLINKIVGFHPDRTLPLLQKTTLRRWFDRGDLRLDTPQMPAVAINQTRQRTSLTAQITNRTSGAAQAQIFLFCDEFTNYNDVAIGQKMIDLMTRLGYKVIIPSHLESGRTYLSKGLLREAQQIANKNVEMLAHLITGETPLIGIEPSAILSFRDEYLDLVLPHLKPAAERIAKNTFLFEEWFAREVEAKKISKESFTQEPKLIKLHGHCHQKALSSLVPVKKSLSLPENYQVQLIPSGCCGMAGSFGYEKEHYELSMQIGELVLFPTVRAQAPETIIAAAGTSCRHQIHDGTGRRALHPVEILWDALI